MCPIEENRDLVRATGRCQLAQWLRKQEQALAEHDELRANAIDHLHRTLRVHVISVAGQREEVEAYGVVAPRGQRLSAHLDAPAEDADQVVTDVPARIGGIDDHAVAAAQPSERDGRVGGVAADRPDVGLAAPEQLDDFALGAALDLVDEARALIVAVDLSFLVRVPLGVAGHEVGVLNVANRAALRVLAGDQVDRLPSPPSFLIGDERLDVADVDRHASLLPSTYDAANTVAKNAGARALPDADHGITRLSLRAAIFSQS